MHYHFDSRDALLVEALEYSYELAGDARTRRPPTARRPRARGSRLMIEACLPLPGDQRDDWLLWVELWLRAAASRSCATTAARLYARLHEWFAEVIAAGVEAGELEPRRRRPHRPTSCSRCSTATACAR